MGILKPRCLQSFALLFICYRKLYSCHWSPVYSEFWILCDVHGGLGEGMHAGTYPAHHVHVGGGHVGVLLSCYSVLTAVNCLHTCLSSQLLYTWVSIAALWAQSVESAHVFGSHTQSLFERVNNDRVRPSAAFHQHQHFVNLFNSEQQNNTPVCTFNLSHDTWTHRCIGFHLGLYRCWLNDGDARLGAVVRTRWTLRYG